MNNDDLEQLRLNGFVPPTESTLDDITKNNWNQIMVNIRTNVETLKILYPLTELQVKFSAKQGIKLEIESRDVVLLATIDEFLRQVKYHERTPRTG